MAIDLSKKRVGTTGKVQVKNADGSLMLDEAGEGAFARLHTPSSKVWESANASMRRKVMKRVRESGGKIENATETPEEIAEFLNAVTEEFTNLEVPLPEGESGAKAIVRAVYADPELGFIRDQMYSASKDWGSFTQG